jgi:CelD/BcsL family acetyltransferase involved in cellulose biosynthesis
MSVLAAPELAPRAASHRHPAGRAAVDDPPIVISLAPLDDRTGLERDWQTLYARADQSLFQSWLWIGTWLETIDSRPLLLTARLEGRVVGLALLCLRRHRRRGLMPVTVLHLHETGDPRIDAICIEYNDILCDRAVADEVRRSCLRFLADEDVAPGVRWDELRLANVTEALGDAAIASGFARAQRDVVPTVNIDLSAVRAAGRPYLDHTSSKFRKRTRRALALYQERGPVRLRRAASIEEALAFFEAAGALNRARWEGRGRPWAFLHPPFRRFHRRLIQQGLPLEAVEVIRVDAGEEAIGYLYNLLDGDTVRTFMFGFSLEADNRLSPGSVSIALAIDEHLRRGTRLFDFMAGGDDYKLRMGRPGPPLYTIVLQRPRLKLRIERALCRIARRFRCRGVESVADVA